MPKTPLDLSQLRVLPLAQRKSEARLEDILVSPDAEPPPCPEPAAAEIRECARRIGQAREKGASVMLIYGAHLIKNGAAQILIRLIERGWITHLATNGAGVIHDWEFSYAGVSTENVRENVAAGQFGSWDETGRNIHLALFAGALDELGFGESVGRRIALSDYPHRDLSVLAAAYRLSVPVTVHPGIGYDIIHQHPNCDGASLGDTALRDFLIFARTVEGLEGGVLLSFGSAIMAPEVYLKALAMARNVAHQEGREIRHFTTAVFDLVPIEGDIHQERAKTDPAYYFRPYKTILVRTVADGGESFYFCGDHRATFPALRHALLKQL